MFLPNRRLIIGDEDFLFLFFNSQPSVISASLLRMASVSPKSPLLRDALIWGCGFGEERAGREEGCEAPQG